MTAQTVSLPTTETVVDTPLNMRDRLSIHVLGSYFVAKTFYAFGGGSIQPADLMLGIMALFLTPPDTFRRLWAEQRLLILFVAWVMIVNTGWAVYTKRLEFIVAGTYYVFNLLVVAVAYATRLRNAKAFDRIVTNWILASIAIEFAAVIIRHSPGRSVGTFNNPNQLSYWAVCAMSVLLVLRDNKTRATDLPFQLMALWCQLSSASRAGIGASAMLFVIWAFFALETPAKRTWGLLGMSLVAVLALITPIGERYIAQSNSVAIAEQRINRDGEASQLEIRNYNRIFEYYEYTVVGAGEGYLSRFRQAIGFDLEIHSTFGTVFFSYGIIGFVLFILFLATLARRAKLGMAIYLLPALVYGLTHQGMRFSFFWLLIGLLISKGSRSTVNAVAQFAKAARPTPVIGAHQMRGPEYLRSLTSAVPRPRDEAGDPA